MSSIHLVGISGSLRQKSYNTALLRAAQELLPLDTTLEIISIATVPMYNADLDWPSSPMRPEEVNVIREALVNAQGILIVSPEYNYSIPGVLKNAIDWVSRGDDSPLLQKPVSLMGVSDGLWGTVRMQMAFQPIFLALEMRQVMPEVMVSLGEHNFDVNGKLTNEKTKAIVRKNLMALREAASALAGL